MQKITPFLWFDDKAEEAALFIPLFLRIPRLGLLPVMETQGRKSQEEPKGQS